MLHGDGDGALARFFDEAGGLLDDDAVDAITHQPRGDDVGDARFLETDQYPWGHDDGGIPQATADIKNPTNQRRAASIQWRRTNAVGAVA
ncbi:MAG TPA: hypothetical protein VGF99_18415, partial [Myxococcota bacterium]